MAKARMTAVTRSDREATLSSIQDQIAEIERRNPCGPLTLEDTQRLAFLRRCLEELPYLRFLFRRGSGFPRRMMIGGRRVL